MKAVIVMLSVVGVITAACSLGTDRTNDRTGDELSDGAMLGEIERLPGGTPVPTDVRTLLDVTCTTGILTVRTNREAVTADMPCDRLLPQTVLERFLGKPVAVRFEGGRLIIENETAGTMELPVQTPKVREIDGTP